MPDPSMLPIKCERANGPEGVVLGTDEAEDVYRSRCHIDTAMGAWQPDSQQIAVLESRLEEFWAAHQDSWRAKSPKFYIRQYAGAIIDGRNWICVNLVSKAYQAQNAVMYRQVPELRLQIPRGVCPEDLWRHQAVGIHVADGGSDFCGVKYDVATGQFSDPNCNGL